MALFGWMDEVRDSIVAALPQPAVPLTPTAGFCVDSRSLRPADIIVSTTREGASRLIRVGTGSSVSHAAVFVGEGNIVEAIGEGVREVTLETALADDVLAVVYRHPAMKPHFATAIVKWARHQVVQKARYSAVGASLSPVPMLCRLEGDRPGSFFCSQLVFEAYRQSGLPLTTLPSSCVTPQMVVEIATQALVYGGHLQGRPTWFPTLAP